MEQFKNRIIAALGLIVLLSIPFLMTARTGSAQQGGGLPALAARVAALEAASGSQTAQIVALQTALNAETARATTAETALQNAINAEIAARKQGDVDTLAAAQLYADTQVQTEHDRATAAEATLTTAVTGLQTLTAPMSLSGTDLTISGVNIHIVNGMGSTETTNGLGNLTVGYNETRGFGYLDSRIGSHNLIVGAYHNYTSYGGLVAGKWNTVISPYSSITGGYNNFANAIVSSISGGHDIEELDTLGWSGGAYHTP